MVMVGHRVVQPVVEEEQVRLRVRVRLRVCAELDPL